MLKRTLLYPATLPLTLILATALPTTYAQDHTQSNLLKGAKARFGKGHINDLTYSPDGTRLAVATPLQIWVYDARTGEELDVYLIEDGPATWNSRIQEVAYSPDGTMIASASSNGKLHLWDANTGEHLDTLVGSCFAFSPDGKTLASGGGDKIGLWELATKHVTVFTTTHTSGISSIAFSPDGKTLASGSYDKTIRLWDAATREHKATLKGHTEQVTSVAFSPDGKTLASGSYDKTIRLWDLVSGVQQAELEHISLVTSVAFSPDGKTLASGSWGGTFFLWDPVSGVQQAELSGHWGSVSSVAFSPDGKTLASGSGSGTGGDGTVKLWDPVAGEYKSTLTAHTSNVLHLVLSPDGATLISGSRDDTIRFWDVVTGEQIAIHTKYRPPKFWDTTISFSPDGKTLAREWSSVVSLWNVITGEQIATLPGYFSGFAFSPNGTILASASSSKIQIWDVVRGTQIATLTGHTYEISYGLAISPDGNTLATGSREGTVSLWDVVSGERIATLTGHTRRTYQLAFSPDGTTLASADGGELFIWDAATGQYKAKTAASYRFAFSPDGQTLAARSWAGDSVKLLDASTLTLKATLPTQTSYVMSVAFSPDGNTLVTGSRDGYIYLWDLTPHNYQLPQLPAYPTLVRLIYFFPSDHNPHPNIDTEGQTLAKETQDDLAKISLIHEHRIRTLAKETQDFYAQQMEYYGFGRKTFQIETDSNGQAVVHHLQGSHPAEDYISQSVSILGDVENLLELELINHIYLVVLDPSLHGALGRVCGIARIPGLSVDGGAVRMDNNGRLAFVYAPASGGCSPVKVTAHELGHVFGLSHDYRDKDYVMNHGRRTARFSYAAAEWLNVHPALNPGQPHSENHTTIEVLSPRASRLQCRIADTDGLHQAQLLFEGNIPNVMCRANAESLHHFQALNGTSDITLEFAATEVKTKAQLRVIDRHGNISWKDLSIKTESSVETVEADVNGDGTVNIQDLVAVAAAFGETGETPTDVNGDGVVNIQDLVAVAAAFGDGVANAPTASHLSQLSPETVQQWLAQAHARNLTDAMSQRGIRFLQQLLVSLTPKETALFANYPNPFNPETWIPYQLAKPADVTLRIYAVDSSLVRVLSLGHKAVGVYQSRSRAAYWDGRNNIGEPVASGVYFYTLTAGEFSATRKMLIRK